MKRVMCCLLMVLSLMVFSGLAFAEEEDSFYPTEEQIEQYKEDGTWDQRVEYNENLGNSQVSSELIKKQLESNNDIATYSNIESVSNRVMPSIGTAKVVMLMVQFPDYQFDKYATVENMRQLMFSEENIEDEKNYPYESLNAYYKRSSYDQLTITGDVLEIYTAEHERDYYSEDPLVLVKEIMNYYDDTVDFSQYDSDTDGVMDAVYINFAGSNTGWGSAWWSCVRTYFENDFTIDGVQLGKTAWIHEQIRNLNGIDYDWNNPFVSTAVHETGHLLGLPDYYNYDNLDNEINTNDMMANNTGDQNIFSKLLLGWLNISDLEIISKDSIKQINLAPLNTNKSGFIAFADDANQSIFSEFYIGEYYVPDGNNTMLTAIRNDTTKNIKQGIRIFHVNGELQSGNWGFKFTNSGDGRKLIQAVNKNESGLNGLTISQVIDVALFYQYGITKDGYNSDFYTGDEFTPFSKPCSFKYENSEDNNAIAATGISITNINTDSTGTAVCTAQKLANTAIGEDIEFKLFEPEMKLANDRACVLQSNVPVWTVGNSLEVNLKDNTDNTTVKMEAYLKRKDTLEVMYSRSMDGQVLKSNHQYTIVIPADSFKTAYGKTNDLIEIPVSSDAMLSYERSNVEQIYTGWITDLISIGNNLVAYCYKPKSGENLEWQTLSDNGELKTMAIANTTDIDGSFNLIRTYDNKNILVATATNTTNVLAISDTGELLNQYEFNDLLYDSFAYSKGIIVKNNSGSSSYYLSSDLQTSEDSMGQIVKSLSESEYVKTEGQYYNDQYYIYNDQGLKFTIPCPEEAYSDLIKTEKGYALLSYESLSEIANFSTRGSLFVTYYNEKGEKIDRKLIKDNLFFKELCRDSIIQNSKGVFIEGWVKKADSTPGGSLLTKEYVCLDSNFNYAGVIDAHSLISNEKGLLGIKRYLNGETYKVQLRTYREFSDVTINLSDFDINQKDVIIGVGCTQLLTTSFSPEDTTERTVKWKSSDESIATITADSGIISGIKKGNVTISATCGGITKTIDVKIGDIKITPPSKIQYIMGEEYDPTGGSVTFEFIDSTEIFKMGELKQSGFNREVSGEQTIQLYKEGLELPIASFKLKAYEIISLSLTPNDNQFYYGQPINIYEMNIQATYRVEGEEIRKELIENPLLKVIKYDPFARGEQTIRIQYGNSSVFSIALREISILQLVKGTQDPIIINQGNALPIDKIKINIEYEDRKIIPLEMKEEYCSNFDPNKIGEQNVTISFGGKTLQYPVRVEANKTIGTHYGQSLSLKSNIVLNYYVDLPQTDFNKINLKVWKKGDANNKSKIDFNPNQYEIIGEKNYYRFSYAVSAKEMGDEFEAQLYSQIGDSEERGSDVFEYSAQKYAKDQLVSTEATDQLKALLRSMLNYGASAQTQFNYQTDKLANSILTEEEKVVQNATVDSQYAGKITKNTIENPKAAFYGNSLLLKDDTYVRVYFTLNQDVDSSKVKLMYSLTGEEAKKELAINHYTSNIYYATITGISAKNLDDLYDVFVAENGQQISEVETYGPLSYAKEVLEKESNAVLKTLMNAMVDYCNKANEYFNTIQEKK